MRGSHRQRLKYRMRKTEGIGVEDRKNPEH